VLETWGRWSNGVLQFSIVTYLKCPTGQGVETTYLRKSASICGSIVSYSRLRFRVDSRLRNVNELINCPLDPDALFRLRIAMPEGLLLAHENAVGTALCRHGANLGPGVT
jgi:hypothetical protein